MEEVRNVVCPFCGSCCDDIQVLIEDRRIIDVKNACVLGKSKFLGYNNERLTNPTVKVDGKPRSVLLTDAVDKAAEFLVKAKYPILYGWGCTSCEATSLGIELAEELSCVIDNVTTVCHGPTIEGVQDVGEVTCSLGEVKARADLILYWGCNPSHAHPRHMVRYGPFSKGMFRASRRERKLVVVDVRRTHTARLADTFLQVKPGTDYEVLTALRSIVRGHDLEVDEVEGIPVESLEELAETMMGCSFGTLFFGVGLSMTYGKHRNIDAALSLVRDLNMKTKFTIMPMRGHFNVTGANAVFTWQTGYPFCVDFNRGYPRYNPGETSIIDILCREECDAALVVASDPLAHFPRMAAKTLTQIPLVAIDPHLTATTMLGDVAVPSAHVGIEAEGTTYRMDGVPLKLKKLVEPPTGVLPDTEVLRMILNRVKEVR